jgi:hypothetical protein
LQCTALNILEAEYTIHYAAANILEVGYTNTSNSRIYYTSHKSKYSRSRIHSTIQRTAANILEAGYTYTSNSSKYPQSRMYYISHSSREHILQAEYRTHRTALNS